MAGAKNMAGASLLSGQSGIPDGSRPRKGLYPGGEPADRTGKAPEAILATYDTKEAEKDPENFARKIARETEWRM